MDIRDYLEAIKQTQDIWDLWDVCREFSLARGLKRFYYAHLPPLGAPDADDLRFRTEGFAPEVVDTYFTSGQYRASRLMKFAKSHIHPFYWDEVPPEHFRVENPRLAALSSGVDEVNGICIPLFGPNGRNGLGSLELPEGVRRLGPETVHDLQWAATLAHLRYCELWLPELGPSPRLSPREQEVLVWVARGKSNTSIAEILGISAHTVDAHLRRIYLKLGVFDRITAAVRAMGVGLIAAGLPLSLKQTATPKVPKPG
jgi:LuxR family transcriptional regulator, quorum-sensing system regulator CciR